MKSKKVLAMGLAGVMAFGMVGCSTPGSETTAAAGDSTTAAATENTSGLKVFRYATATDPTSLDSCKGNSVADNEVNHLIQEGLVRNNCGEIAPGLAESWELLLRISCMRSSVWQIPLLQHLTHGFWLDV